MAAKSGSKPPQSASVDKKTEITFKTIESLRASGAIFQDLIKAASNYQKQCQRLSEAGKAMADALQKVASLQQNDIGEGIQKLSALYRDRETRRDNLSRVIQEDLINTLQKSVKPDEAELAQFESDYKKVRDNTRRQIATLEQNSKKAGKRGPEALKQAIASLNDKIKEADQIKADKLRSVLLLERKRYCNFLGQWSPVVGSEIEVGTDSIKFRDQEQNWKTLASSNQQLPTALEELIKQQQERTFVSIQSVESGSYEGYNDYSSYDSYETSATSNDWGSGGHTSSPTPGYHNNYGYGASTGLGTATALYDFAGEQKEDLPFYAGDVINVTKEDDGSGWLTGTLNGRSGIFPSSYVQRN